MRMRKDGQPKKTPVFVSYEAKRNAVRRYRSGELATKIAKELNVNPRAIYYWLELFPLTGSKIEQKKKLSLWQRFLVFWEN